MIQDAVAKLVCYGLKTGLLGGEDAILTANRLISLLGIDVLDEATEQAITACAGEVQAAGAGQTGAACAGKAAAAGAGEATAAGAYEPAPGELQEILDEIIDYAVETGQVKENTVTYRDLFDTKVMGELTERPSDVIRKFRALYEESPEKATDAFYRFCQDNNYIRRERIAKDRRWKAPTGYGDLDITINLSKPEKDPKAIAAARLAQQSAYPRCQLCYENVGYAGRLNHPARQNLRVIPLKIDGGDWCMQYSPYVYYNEHCIVFNRSHVPMVIDRSVFRKLFDFVRQFPHYFIGSNADLPIVGGSILAHEHFQGGRYEFAMAKAPVEEEIHFDGYSDVKAGIVRWPMSVIRLSGEDAERLTDLADKILTAWRGYTDEAAFIFAETDGEKHNTITPIARMRDGKFELDLVLRNNITTDEHPLGVYHPHAELHHIKKENIGLIEVMGCAILPARLNTEMAALRAAVLEGRDYRADETLEKHADWMDAVRAAHPDLSEANIDEVMQTEIGKVFAQVLECAGVYKRTDEGRAAMRRFIESI